ncbi:MAG: molybdopterin cofactor-binding domain-containing protein, partial [Pseudomonadota bacterium]
MSKFGVSQPVKRVEDTRLLTGAGAYVDDLAWAGQARAYYLRSPVAHARIATLNVDAARALPGVLAVYTAADLEADGVAPMPAPGFNNRDGSPSAKPPRPVLAADRVRYVGEAVALVVAETLAIARDAAEAIEFEFDDLDAVVEMPAALGDGAPQIHEAAPGNLCFDWGLGDEAAADAALAAAARVVRIELVNNRVVSNPMETRGVLARWDDAAGKLTMESNTQGVWDAKRTVSKALGLEPEQVRITTGDVGGGFGTKGYSYPEQVSIAYAARALGRPVKWIADRSEGFLSDAMGRDHLTVAEAAFDADHRITALKVQTLAGMGAYLSPFAPFIPTGAASKVMPGVYDFQTIFIGVKGVFTNTTPVDAYRGAGRPESIYMLERLIDKAAR